LWFHFGARWTGGDAPSAKSLSLTLRHTGTLLGGGQPETMRPVVQVEGDDWTRLGAPVVQQEPDGQKLVSWDVVPAPYEIEVAWCFPYGPESVDALISDCNGYWKVDSIGVSQAGRAMRRLSNSYGETDPDRPGVFCTAQQHSGETSGAWVLDGFLRRIAEISDDAPLIWAIPTANIDGVVDGDYGKDPFPHDLNRAWGQPPMRHETLVMQQDIRRWMERCRPSLAIDFHAPGACENSGAYLFLPRKDVDEEQKRVARIWAERLGSWLPDEIRADPFSIVPDYPSRWPGGAIGGYLAGVHGVCGMTIETPYSMVGDHVLTRTDYQNAGASLADGLADHLSGS
ncbi:MAG: M14 family zinc carboxypeptidase, partial [Candidatus Latescibacteria bacterium]|nr:M14 family zinc carboxypeptidase [Candidatus Latescibacterota bacterium]